jgi:5-methylcytosine-specific restriction endonuclease McrA
MKDFAAALYKSKRWQTTRLAYLKSVGGLCERCLKKGLYKPAVIVHHKVYLTAENINNPEITLNWNNLEAVCRECHEDEHRGQDRRYVIHEDGTVEIK